jgi:hypothetical protein
VNPQTDCITGKRPTLCKIKTEQFVKKEDSTRMNEHAKRIRKPRCFCCMLLPPPQCPAADANHILNAFIGDPALPLAIFHDHFIGQPGGMVIFYVETHRSGMRYWRKNIWKAGGWRSNR